MLGPVVEPARADRSVARAQAAWPLHVAGLLGAEPDGLVRADEHLLALLLAAEPELAADLCERAVAPLQALPAGAAARGEQTLRAWLDAHGDVSAAAAALHVHPQTVRYRLAGLREVFGDALDDPGARLELAIALRMTQPGASPSPDADRRPVTGARSLTRQPREADRLLRVGAGAPAASASDAGVARLHGGGLRAAGQRVPVDLAQHLRVLLGQRAADVAAGRSARRARAPAARSRRSGWTGRSGNRWCSIWWLRLPVMRCSSGLPVEVRRAEHLADVPLAARLAVELLLGERLDAVGEVAAEDDRVRPDVAHDVGRQVPGSAGQDAAGPDSSGTAT